MNTRQIADEWERLVNEPGATRLTPLDKGKLPASTLNFLAWYEQANLAVQQVVLADGTDNVDGSFLFHIAGDDYAPYFHHVPRRALHMWAAAGFHEAVDNNVVIARLGERATGVPAEKLIGLYEAVDQEYDRAQSERN